MSRDVKPPKRAAEIQKFVLSLTGFDEISWAWDCLGIRRNALEVEAAQAFVADDEVEFEGSRSRGTGTITGVVVGMAGSSVKVKALRYALFGQPGPNEVWRVPPSQLRKVGNREGSPAG